MIRICEQCGTSFTGSNSKLCLCRECKEAHYRDKARAYYHSDVKPKKPERLVFCKRCKAALPPRSGEQRYCSDCKKVIERERGRSEHTRELARKRYAADPLSAEKKRVEGKAWRKKNQSRFMEIVKQALHRRREQKKSSDPLTTAQWREIQASYGGKCVYCGSGGKMTFEHVVPLSKGGTHTADNVVPACLDCNRKKNRKSLLQFLYQLVQA